MDIYSHPDFELVQDMIKQKMLLLLMDLRDQENMTKEEMGLELLANKKAYGFLKEFFEDIQFYKKEETPAEERNYE